MYSGYRYWHGALSKIVERTPDCTGVRIFGRADSILWTWISLLWVHWTRAYLSSITGERASNLCVSVSRYAYVTTFVLWDNWIAGYRRNKGILPKRDPSALREQGWSSTWTNSSCTLHNPSEIDNMGDKICHVKHRVSSQWRNPVCSLSGIKSKAKLFHPKYAGLEVLFRIEKNAARCPLIHCSWNFACFSASFSVSGRSLKEDTGWGCSRGMGCEEVRWCFVSVWGSGST